MPFTPAYPTREHQQAAETFIEYFHHRRGVEAILLVNSCARGKATPDSCLDLIVILNPEEYSRLSPVYQKEWELFYEKEPVFVEIRKIGKYANVEPEFINGIFHPGEHSWTSGPDGFELEIGNFLAYSFPLWQNSPYLAQLKAQWLPFYNEPLRSERLNMIRHFCQNNLDHITLYARRGLHFQCFDRFYNAYKEFLQALFIARRTYPIAYDKLIREQVVEILGLPDLYQRLPALFEIKHFESSEIVTKAEELRGLLDEYTIL
jgi:predicted nucleotidyltransferase